MNIKFWSKYNVINDCGYRGDTGHVVPTHSELIQGETWINFYYSSTGRDDAMTVDDFHRFFQLSA